MFDLSPIEVLIVLVIALLVFGPKRLPEMARGLGRGIRDFKDSLAGGLGDAPPAPRRADVAPAIAQDAAAAPVPAGEDDLEGIVVPGSQRPGATP